MIILLPTRPLRRRVHTLYTSTAYFIWSSNSHVSFVHSPIVDATNESRPVELVPHVQQLNSVNESRNTGQSLWPLADFVGNLRLIANDITNILCLQYSSINRTNNGRRLDESTLSNLQHCKCRPSMWRQLCARVPCCLSNRYDVLLTFKIHEFTTDT